MKKKIISLLLAVVMIVGMLPLSAITAFAEGGTSETLTLGDVLDTVSGTYSYSRNVDFEGIPVSVSVEISIGETEIVIESIVDNSIEPSADKRIIKSNGTQKYIADTIVDGVPQYELDYFDEMQTLETVLQTKITLNDKEEHLEDFLTGEGIVIPIGSYYWESREIYFFDADEDGKTRKLCYGNTVCEKERDETVYSISVSPTEHGSLSCDKFYEEGASVNIKVSPHIGYALKPYSLKATYNDGAEKELTVFGNPDGTYTFFMPAYDVTLSAEFEALPVEYFYVENITDNAGSVIWQKIGENAAADLEYSTDKEDWTAVILGNEITVPAQGKLYFRAGTTGGFANTVVDHVSLYSDVLHNIGGDITTLLEKDGRVQKLENSYQFTDLFKDDIMLIRADELILTPKTLFLYCYSGMFSGCTNLTKAPALPATELTSRCYAGMFSGCTNLTKAPVLPATDFSSDCYDSMFDGCTALNSVTVGFKKFDGYIWEPSPDIRYFNSSTDNWLNGVAEEGTFYVPDDFDESYFEEFGRNASSVPEGWTIEKMRAVTVSPTKNGIVNTDKAVAVSGDTVSITVTPAAGYVLSQGSLKATYYDGTEEKELILTPAQNSTDTYTFIMPAYNVTLSAEFVAGVLASAINTVSGTYIGSAKWVDDYGVHEVLAWITLNSDEFSTECISSDGESKWAAKTIIDHSGSRSWSTTTFDGVGAPVYDEESGSNETNTTIDDFLKTPIAFTPFDMDAPVYSGGTVKIPAGSFSMDYFAFYDVQNRKTQKMYMENEHMELTREEMGPFTLRELIGKVGGTYSYAETLFTGQEKISANATYTFNENEFRTEGTVVNSGGEFVGSKSLCNAEGTTEWGVVGVDASGKPIYSEPLFNPDYTIENLLDCVGVVNRYPVELETAGVTGTVSVVIPAGSYYFEALNCYFYGMQNGKTMNMYMAGTVLPRVDNPVHEHTFSNKWSNSPTLHWHDATCGHTEFVSGFGVHTFGEGVTEGNKTTYTCTVCGYEKVEIKEGPAHEHTYSENWTCDPYYHWHNATCEHTNIFSDLAEHSFDNGVVNGNVTTYTCTVCGYKKFVYNTADDNEGEIVTGISYTGISLTLGSDIAINFYMDLTEEARQNGTMTFDIGGRIVTLKGTDAKWNETEKKYYFQTPLTALEMNETVKATFTYNGIEYVQEYSVADYIDKIVGNEEKYGTEAAALARKIANYGYYAQIYLESIHTNVHIVNSGDGYDRMNKFENVDIDTQAAIEALAEYSVKVTGASDNLSLYGTTVYFDSATALNYYVTVKNGEKPTATAQNTVTGKSKDVEIKLYKDNIYIVSVKDITATELADDIEVTINGELTITGSVFAYCNSVVQAHNIDGATDKDIFAVNAMAAFYEYYTAAVDYVASQVPTYTVTFDNDTYCGRLYQTVKHGEKAHRPTDPITANYVFDGWYADEERTVPWNFDTLIIGNTTIYGKWKEETVEYTVTFNMMGHGEPISSQTVEKNGKVTKPTSPTADDKEFAGWYKDSNYNEKWNFDTDTVTANTTLYAKWREKTDFSQYSLCGVINGQNYGMTNDPITPNEPYMFSSDGKLTATFTGSSEVKIRNIHGNEWYSFEERAHDGRTRKLYQTFFDNRYEGYRMNVPEGRQVTFTLSKDENGDLMLGYEVPPCTVSFNMMEHGTQIPNQTVEYGGYAQKPADPTEEGYIFKGWFEDENCTVPYYWDWVNRDITLYAEWTPIQ